MTDIKHEIETLSSTLVHETEWIKVRHDKVRFPDGSLGAFDTIERRNFVGILAVDENQLIYLVEQYRYARRMRLVEIPMGAIEQLSGESAEDAARRELKEETGLVASRMVHLGQLPINAGYTLQHFDVFLATGLEKGPQELDPGEQGLVVHALPVSEVERRIRENILTNEHTLAAFCLARLKGLI